jgi:hypothetical protein
MFEKGKRNMSFKTTCITASTLALCSVANAEIIYSGFISESASDTSDPVSVDIAGLNYEFGILVGGPLDYSYITTTSENAGIFIPVSQISSPAEARNFSAGDTIGTFTEVLDMFPLGNGDENVDLTLHDYAGTLENPGQFSATGTGYVGFGFGTGVNYNYGWMEFTSWEEEFEGGVQSYIALTGWAYNDELNGSIEVGQIPAPGALGLLALAGLAGRRRRQG